MINLTDQDILLRLAAFEDAFVERKTANDSRDWLKTVVAFANTAPVGMPAILFIGVRDNGEIEGNANLDSLQKTLSEKLALAYPPIYYLPKVLQHDGKQFLAVIVPGSPERPHFAGPAYIRDGSQSVPSSAKQFDLLIAERSSKVREILKWKNKAVTFRLSAQKNMQVVMALGTSGGGTLAGTVVDCNQFYLTVESIFEKNSLISFPVNAIDINFDHHEHRLELRLRD